MSDFDLTSIHTDSTEHSSHSPTPFHHAFLVNIPDSDADRAMEYLGFQSRQLPVRALALDPHARPCPSFSPRHLTRRVGTIGRCIIATSS